MSSSYGCRVLGEIRFQDKIMRKTLLEGAGLDYSDTHHDGERMLLSMYHFFGINGRKPQLLSETLFRILTEGLELNVVDIREKGTDIIYTVAGEVNNVHDLRNIFSYVSAAGYDVFFVVDFDNPGREDNLLLFSKHIDGGVSRLYFGFEEYGFNDVKLMSQSDFKLLEMFLKQIPEYVKVMLHLSPPKGCSRFLSKINSLV